MNNFQFTVELFFNRFQIVSKHMNYIKYLFLGLVLLSIGVCADAQVLISPIAGSLSGSDFQLNYSVGEVVTNTIENNPNITQGFHQPNSTISEEGPCNGDSDPKCLVTIPTGITVNEDGVNDVWILDGLDLFPDNEIIITNRWGETVFDASPYNNDWGGKSNGKELPQGTYYYLLIVNDGNGNESKLTGSIHIIR